MPLWNTKFIEIDTIMSKLPWQFYLNHNKSYFSLDSFHDDYSNSPGICPESPNHSLAYGRMSGSLHEPDMGTRGTRLGQPFKI